MTETGFQCDSLMNLRPLDQPQSDGHFLIRCLHDRFLSHHRLMHVQDVTDGNNNIVTRSSTQEKGMS